MSRVHTSIAVIVFTLLISVAGMAQNITNYTFSASAGTFTEITGGTQLLGTASDEAVSATTSIGFTFVFMASPYTHFTVSSNGYLVLLPNSTATGSNSLTNNLSTGPTTTSRPVIAPLWDDIMTDDNTGNVQFIVTGTAPNRVLTVQWLNMKWNYLAAGPVISFQAKLYESDGKIEYVYRQDANAINTGSASVGIANTTTGSGNFLSVQSLTTGSETVSSTTEVTSLAIKPDNGRTFTFQPPATPAAPTNLAVTGAALTSVSLSWTDNATTESAFLIQRSTDNVTFVTAGTVAASTGSGNTVTATVTGLAVNTQYFFRVAAASEGSLSSFITAQGSTGQPILSGTRQIPSTNYPTIRVAIDSMRTKGVVGPLVFELLASYTSAGEGLGVSPLTIPEVFGVNATNTVTFRPASGVTNLSITGSNSTAIFILDSADYIIFDGRPGGSGIQRHLTIENTNTTASSATVLLRNEASYNTFRSLILLGAKIGTTSGIVNLSTSTPISNRGNSYNNFLNNRFGVATGATAGTNIGIYSSGTSGKDNKYITVSGNEFVGLTTPTTSTTCAGVFATTASAEWIITGNHFYQPTPTTYTTSNTTQCISINTGWGYTIDGNFIGGSSLNATGAAWNTSISSTMTFAGIFASTSTISTSVIRNNKIANILITPTTTSGVTFHGIQATAGNNDIMNNIIGGATTVASSDTIRIQANAASTNTLNGITYGGSTVNISNNTVCATRINSTTTAIGNMVGINWSSTPTTFSLIGNTVGSTNPGLGLSIQTTSTSGGYMAGFTLGASTLNMQNNLVQNLSNQQPGTSTRIAACSTATTISTATIQNNVFRDITTSSINTGTSTSTAQSVLGMVVTLASTVTFNNNRIFNLSNSASTASAVCVTGLLVSSGSLTTNVYSRNTIYGLTLNPANTSTTATINGIVILAGATFQNNAVTLGSDASGSSIGTGAAINGLSKQTSIAANMYHNTVYIGGTVTATTAANTFGLNSAQTSTTDSVYNNIFVNARSGGPAFHYAMGATTVTTSLRTNNIYFTTAANGRLGRNITSAADLTTIAAIRSTFNCDAQSFTADPGLRAPLSSPPDLRLNSPTPAERAGFLISRTVDDIEGELRSSLTPVDIGCDGGGYAISTDLVSPTITYTPLSTPTLLTGERTLTAFIVDAGSGVPTTGAGVPTLYWRRNSGTWTAQPGTYISGVTYTFTFGAGSSANDIIQYYIVAQDNAGNTTALPLAGTSGFTTNPPAVTTAPTIPSQYTVTGGICGTLTVGTGGTYSTLKAAFDFINTNIVTCNTTISILSTTNETATCGLQPVRYGPGGPFTITIQPAAGTTDTIRFGTGAFPTGQAVPLIDLQGADYVIIDGRQGGSGTSRSLTLENNVNSTGGNVVRFTSDATNDTVRHCNIRGWNTSFTGGLIWFGSYNVTIPDQVTNIVGNSNNAIDNNDFYPSQGSSAIVPAVPAVGIYSAGSSSAYSQFNKNNSITNNTFRDMYNTGAQSAAVNLSSGSSAWTISNNHVFKTVTTAPALSSVYYGINVNNSTGFGFTINNNFIGGSASSNGGAAWQQLATGFTHSFVGINLFAGTTESSTINGNKISNITFSSGSTSTTQSTTVTGMWSGINSITAALTVSGNTIGGNLPSDTIRIVSSQTSSIPVAVGISVQPSSATATIQNNLIGGNTSGVITAGGTSFTSATSSGVTFTGIWVSGSGILSVNNNTIGSTSAANAINVNPSSSLLTATTTTVIGINSTHTGPPIGMANNTVANMFNGSTSTGSGTFIRGISSTSGVNTITGNLVRNLSCLTNNTFTSTSSAAIGIMVTSTAVGISTAPTGCDISNNTVHSIGCAPSTASSGVSVTGMFIQTSSYNVSTTLPNLPHFNQLNGNRVSAISTTSTSTSATVSGILHNSGNCTYSNNIVHVGSDSVGSDMTNPVQINAFWKFTSSFIRVYHNTFSVIGNNATGATNTFAFRRSFAATTVGSPVNILGDSVYNNIFANTRTNDGTGTSKHIAYGIESTVGLLSNNNLCRSLGASGSQFGALISGAAVLTDYATHADWRAGTGQDVQSAAGNPNFRVPTGTPASIDLRVQGTTPAEGAGLAGTNITTDAEGDSRTSTTPVDIGADAGNYTANDIFGPQITFTPLAVTNSTDPRTLTVTITDRTGVATSGNRLPNLYWRINTAGTWNTSQGVSVGSNQYTFTYGNGVAAGDSVFYYIVAQDTVATPNLAITPALGATGLTAAPPAATTPPTTLFFYRIQGSLCGTFTIGTGGNYATMGDAVAALNNNIITCDVIMEFITNTNETAGMAINGLQYGTGGPYRVTFRPAAGTSDTVRVTTTGPMVLLTNNVERIIFDGRRGGTGASKSLVFENNGNSAQAACIWMQTDTRRDTIRHMVLRASSLATNTGAITFGGGSIVNGVDDVLVSDNEIRETSQNLRPQVGIFCGGNTLSPAVWNSNIVITNNAIFNHGTTTGSNSGITVGTGVENVTVTNNNIYQQVARGFTTTNLGISVVPTTGGGTFTVSGNFIGGSAPNCGGAAWMANDSTSSSFTTFVGINIAGNASTTMNVENNKIANFKYMTATGSSPYWSGIQVSTSSLGNTVITNNQIGGAGADSVRGFNATTSGAMFGMNLVTVPSVSQNTFTVSNNTISNIRSDNTVNATTTSILNLFANVIGINVGGGANHLSATITNNTIGGSSANEGLYAINPTLATSQQFAYGVRTSYTGTLNLTNNTIRHIYNNAAGATQSTSNHVAAGILATSGINVMTGNSITNVYNSSPQNQTGISASAAGIICTSTIGNNTISGNTIYNVGNTSTVGVPQVAGIIHSGQTGGALTTISRNNINSLTLATNNTNASLLGINIVNGFANVVNNMVRLGIDGQGTNLTTGYFIAGILEQSTNPVNIYHNSVYVGGANVTNGSDGSSSNLTFAIRRLIPPTQPAGIGTLLDRVYNNIFVNARSNVSGGVGKHYAVGLDLGLQYVSDHNIMQASGTGGVLYGLGVPFITTDFTTFDAVRSTLGIDMNSAAANPNFVNPTGDFLNVNLRVQSPTPAEASGTSLASVVTDDFDGQTRSNFTPIDIGASAGNYTVSDVIPPMITYTPLSNSSVESSRSVTGIAITDASGVNTSAGTRPRIYFKKGSDANVFVGNTSADNGWKFVEATNTTSPFQFSLDYSLLTGGTVAVGDVIQYYVIAQDMVTTPNVAINSGLPASAVTSVAMSGTQFPMGGTINTYQITGSFSGTVQVGSGQTYSCLTCEGGLFQAINTIGVLSGNLTVQVTSNLTEDGTHALNQWAESGSGNYSLRIVPSSASNRTIEGVYPAPNLSTPSAGLIRFNAVDRVTIDGRFNGAGSFLTFRNNNITSLAAISVIHFISAGVGQSCENDTVRNCNIQCATNFTTSPTGTPTYIGVYVGGTATTVTQFPSTTNTGFDHNNIVISNNDFSTLTHAVVARGFSPNNLINRLNISNNTFGSATNSQTVSVRGVDLTGCNNFTVHRNTFTNISSQLSTYMAGIDLAQWTSNGTVSNNIICGVSNTLAGVQGAYGINISTTTGVSNINIFNNAISGIITYGANSDITTNLPVGIRLLGGVNIRMYHNTIRMSGTFTNPNASNAAGVLIGSANVQSSELRNNIISLAMNGGSGTKCHALSLPFTGLIQFGIMNNNDYTTTGSQNNLVLFNNTDFTSISAWQAGNGGLDANSVSVPVSFTGTGCSQYYVPSVNPSLFGSNAVSSVVSTDIDGLARSRYYMGADEVTPTLAIGSQPQSQNLCATQTLTFSAVNPSTTFDDNVSRTVNYTYQWQRNNTDIAGATNSLYTKANITTADAGNYRVIIKISTADSIVSNVAVITVAQPITITQQPTAPAPFCLGTGGFSLSMSATGSNLTYQWQHDRSRTGNWVNIPGATTTSYLVSNPVANDSGLYRCLVTGAAVCTPPTVATNSVDVVIRVPVAITSAPTNQIACIGNAFTMTLGVSGTVTSIQWQQDRLRNNTWVNVGTNSATYSVASA